MSEFGFVVSPSCFTYPFPSWYLYFLNVVFGTWPELLILYLFLTMFDASEMGEFFVLEETDIDLDTASIASSEYC
jgi:hypothetical protein